MNEHDIKKGLINFSILIIKWLRVHGRKINIFNIKIINQKSLILVLKLLLMIS